MCCAHQDFANCFHLFTRNFIQSIIPHAQLFVMRQVAIDFQGAALTEALIKKGLGM